jgi:hypothetical protein
VCPFKLAFATADAGSPTTPADTEPIPIYPLFVNVFFTKTLYPFVFKNMPELIVRLL